MPSQILIRPAVPADFDAIARITRDAYLAAGYFESADHPYMQQIQNVGQRAAAATVWVAEREGRILGSVTLAVAGEPYADIAFSDEFQQAMQQDFDKVYVRKPKASRDRSREVYLVAKGLKSRE